MWDLQWCALADTSDVLRVAPAVRRVGRSTGRPTREGLSLRPVSGPPSTTDALRGTIAIHDHGLTTVGLRMVWAETMAINEPSRSVIVKPRMRW